MNIPSSGLAVLSRLDPEGVDGNIHTNWLAFQLHPPRWTDKILCRFFGAPAKPRAALGFFPDDLIRKKSQCLYPVNAPR